MKELCKLDKEELKGIIPKLVEQLQACRFVCKKCARVAPDKDWLCKPTSIRKLINGDAKNFDDDDRS